MDNRHKADYEATETFDPADVKTLIAEVETLVTAIGAPANLPEGFVGPVPASVTPSRNSVAKLLSALKRRFFP